MQAARLRVRVKVPVSPAGSARMVTVCTSGRLTMIPVRRKEEGGRRKDEGGMMNEDRRRRKEEGGQVLEKEERNKK